MLGGNDGRPQTSVIPAKAGIQCRFLLQITVDGKFRMNDRQNMVFFFCGVN
jgi:hypothetical protein